MHPNDVKLLRWTSYAAFILLFIVGLSGALLTTTINIDYSLLKTLHLVSALIFIGIVGVHGLLGLKRIVRDKTFYKAVIAIFFIFYVVLLYVVLQGIPF